MPRKSERLEALEDIENATESATWSVVLLRMEEEDKVLEAHIRDLKLIPVARFDEESEIIQKLIK